MHIIHVDKGHHARTQIFSAQKRYANIEEDEYFTHLSPIVETITALFVLDILVAKKNA